MSEKFLRLLKGFSLRFIVIAGIFLLALFLFGLIANEIVLENENQLDRVVFQKLQGITHPATTKVMVDITFFGSSYFLGPAYVVLLLFFLFVEKNRQVSRNIAVISIAGTIILFSLKAIFHRHRPPDPLVQNVNGFSFPSGHAFSAFTFFGLLIYMLWTHQVHPVLRRVLTALLVLFASAIAFSRVYLHVHYASDVLAGLLLCLVWLVLSFWVLQKIDERGVE